MRGRDRASANAKRMMRVDAGAGEDRRRRSRLPRASPRCDAAAVARIFALRILAHDHPIEVLGPDTRAAAPAMPGRMRVGRTLAYWSKALADGEPQAPERDVVGHVGRADRAEIDRVEGCEAHATPSAGIMHAVALVIVGAPVEVARRRARNRPRARRKPPGLRARRDDFRADAVTADRGDAIALHDGHRWGRFLYIAICLGLTLGLMSRQSGSIAFRARISMPYREALATPIFRMVAWRQCLSHGFAAGNRLR